MNKKQYILLTCLCSLMSFSSFAQGFDSYSKTEKDSIKNIDYINKDYKFLDENFKIDVNELKNLESTALILEDNFTYKDSLRNILKYNLKSDYAVHLAFHRILTPWERTSFYLWKSVKETKKLAKSFGYSHPYLFYQFLISEDIEKAKSKLFKNLLNKLESELKVDQNFESNKELMKFAFKNNPEREKAMKAYFKKTTGQKH